MRLAVVADIHGNLPALDAIVDDMGRRNVDAVINLGDCVSGPLWPRETLARLQSLKWPTVRGNHDRAVGEGPRDRLGGSDGFAFDALEPAGRAWLRDLPSAYGRHAGIRAFHACPDNDNAYLLENQHGSMLVPSRPETIAKRLGRTEAALVLTAHSHLPRLVQLPDGPWILNPGSVGCPAYDDDSTDPPHSSEVGSPSARYAIVERASSGPLVALLSIPYDHAAAAARADSNGRSDWGHALRTGLVLRRSAEP